MTNTPKDKTPREIAEELIEHDVEVCLRRNGLHQELGDVKARIEAAIAAERQKALVSNEREREYKWEWEQACERNRNDKENIASLSAENERLTIKATNWEIVAAGFEEWAIHLRDEINEALSFGPTYKPELKGWVAQFVEWQKRMRESIWIKKPEALTSPQEKKEPATTEQFLKDKKAHEEWSAKQDGKFKGDSAGPEHNPLLTPEDEEAAREFNIRQAEQAVIEAARKHPHQATNPCPLCDALNALDRARGEGKDEHGH